MKDKSSRIQAFVARYGSHPTKHNYEEYSVPRESQLYEAGKNLCYIAVQGGEEFTIHVKLPKNFDRKDGCAIAIDCDVSAIGPESRHVLDASQPFTKAQWVSSSGMLVPDMWGEEYEKKDYTFPADETLKLPVVDPDRDLEPEPEPEPEPESRPELIDSDYSDYEVEPMASYHRRDTGSEDGYASCDDEEEHYSLFRSSMRSPSSERANVPTKIRPSSSPILVKPGQIEITIHRGVMGAELVHAPCVSSSVAQYTGRIVRRKGNVISSTKANPGSINPSMRAFGTASKYGPPIKFTFIYASREWLELEDITQGRYHESAQLAKTWKAKHIAAVPAMPNAALKRKNAQADSCNSSLQNDHDDEEPLPQQHIKIETPTEEDDEPIITAVRTTNTIEAKAGKLANGVPADHTKSILPSANMRDTKPKQNDYALTQTGNARKKARLMLELEEIKAQQAEIRVRKQLMDLEGDNGQ